MYAHWFGLTEPPFAITPDPRYLYLSGRHSEALAHLVYGITESGGFLQLTGEVGTGKTTLVRTLLERLPDGVDVALVLNPRQTPLEFVQTICDELHCARAGCTTLKEHVDALNAHLLAAHAAGKRTVVIIDEAQALPTDVLEQVRLLTNLETATHKLLQIVLVGQPELRDTLARADLRQLAQRITARWHLAPLDAREARAYVDHRLKVAGAEGPIFSAMALTEVHRVTGGVPRLINVVCDRALLGAFSQEKREVDGAIVGRAAREVLGDAVATATAAAAPPALRGSWLALGALAAVLLVGAGYGLGKHLTPGAGTVAATAAGDARGPAAISATDAGPAATAADPRPAVAAPSVAAPLPADTDLRAQLDSGALAADTDAALGALFTLWQQRYAPGPEGSACAQAAGFGLRCRYHQGNWNTLRLFDRPAVLTLETGAGRSYNAVLIALDAQRATLAFGPRTVVVPLTELDVLWFGESLMLWQVPPQGVATLRPGQSGDGVRWLRGKLARLRGVDPATVDGGDYDETLTGWVREFQRSRRIKADGVAGETTFVHLDSALPDPGTPRLADGAP
jgi:general secretion pathway protein A